MDNGELMKQLDNELFPTPRSLFPTPYFESAVPLRFPAGSRTTSIRGTSFRRFGRTLGRFVTGITRLLLPWWSFEELRVTRLSVGDPLSLAAIPLPSRPWYKRRRKARLFVHYTISSERHRAVVVDASATTGLP